MATPAYWITTKKDYENELANSQAYQSQVQQINDYFGLGVQQAQEEYNYDISDAYANYKRQQLATMSQQNIGIGDREYAAQQLGNTYQQTAKGIGQTYQSQLDALAANYAKKTEDLGKTISKEAQQQSDLYDALEKFGYANNATFGLSGTYETRYNDLYSTQDDMSRILTEEGQDYFNKMLYGDDATDMAMRTRFMDELAEENKDLYEYAKANWNKFAATTTGRNIDEAYAYDNTEKSAAHERIMKQQNKNYVSNISTDDLTKTGKVTINDKTYKEASKRELKSDEIPRHVKSGDVFSDVHAVINSDGSVSFTDNMKMITQEGDKYYEYTLSNEITPRKAENVAPIPEKTSTHGLSAGSLSQTDASVYKWNNDKNTLSINGKKYKTSTYGGVKGKALSDNEKALLKKGEYKYGDVKTGVDGELYCLLAYRADAMSNRYDPVWAKLKEVQ